jgi:PKD repeat protein
MSAANGALRGLSSAGAAAAPGGRKSLPALRRAAMLVAVTTLVVLWACLTQPINLSGSDSDGGQDGSSTSSDGNAALIGQFTIGGCSDLSFPAGEVHCVGTAPLRVTLVLIEIGATTHRWKVVAQSQLPDGGVISDGGTLLDGGIVEVSLLDDTASRAQSPQLTIQKPGMYQVTLGVAGPGGTATAAGTILVLPAPLGEVCTNDAQCAVGLRCLCGLDTPGRDGSCPGALQAGICTRSCDGQACPTGSQCLDLSRTISMGADGGTSDAWRQPICVASCSGGQRCRADLTCRELPTLPPGGHVGAPYAFASGCFLAIPGGVGDSCLTANGQLASTDCATGLCEPLGLRNLCTAECTPGCPTSAACATWNSTTTPAPAGPRCLLRCDAMNPCADPLLACIASGGVGPLGFSLMGEPAATTVCAPRSCAVPADCPGGRCATFPGGSFCLHN